MNPQSTKPQPDLQALALTKAIRQHESGGNYNAVGDVGTSTGAYQYQPNTWKQYSKQILGTDNASMTPENQNAVTYGMIKTWKDSGMGPAEIAAKWNSGSEKGWENKVGTTTINGKDVAYNTPAYVQSVVGKFKEIYPQVQQQFGGQQPTALPNNQGQEQSVLGAGLQAGLTATANLIPSAYNFAKGVVKSFNPLNTLNTLGEVGNGLSDLSNKEGSAKAVWDVIKGLPEAAYQTLVPKALQQLVSGDIEGASKTLQEDPFGQIAPLVLAAEGTAKLADKYAGGTAAALAEGKPISVSPSGVAELPKGKYSSAFDNTVSTIAKPLIDLTGKAVNPFGATTSFARSAISHLTSFTPETIIKIIKDPKSFSSIAQDSINRGSVADQFSNAIDKFHGIVKEGGTAYQDVIKPDKVINVPENWISDVLSKGTSSAESGGSNIPFNLKLEPQTGGGLKVIADTKSFTRNPADINAVQTFVDNWSNKTQLTPQEFINMRSDLSGLGKLGRDIGTNSDASLIGRALRADANKTMRPQIEGLKEIDNKMAPLYDQAKQIKKDFLNSDGTFKDNMASKVANSLNKQGLLSRMEEVSPGITKTLETLQAVEDINKAYGNKVGAYTRSIIEGGAIFHGNIPLIITSILTHPKIAIQILRGFGATKEVAGKVSDGLNVAIGNIPKDVIMNSTIGSTVQNNSINKE